MNENMNEVNNVPDDSNNIKKSEEKKNNNNSLLAIIIIVLLLVAVGYVGYTKFFANDNHDNGSEKDNSNNNDSDNKVDNEDNTAYNETKLKAWLEENEKLFIVLDEFDKNSATAKDYGRFISAYLYVTGLKNDSGVTIKEGHTLYEKYNYEYGMTKKEALNVLKKYFGESDMTIDYDKSFDTEALLSYSDADNYYLASTATELYDWSISLVNIDYDENKHQAVVLYNINIPYPDNEYNDGTQTITIDVEENNKYYIIKIDIAGMD